MKEGRKHRHETLAVTDKKEKKIIIKKQTNLSKVKLPKTPCSSTLLLSPSVNSDCAFFLPSVNSEPIKNSLPPSSPDRNISSLQNHFFILIFIHIIRKRISLSSLHRDSRECKKESRESKKMVALIDQSFTVRTTHGSFSNFLFLCVYYSNLTVFRFHFSIFDSTNLKLQLAGNQFLFD